MYIRKWKWIHHYCFEVAHKQSIMYICDMTMCFWILLCEIAGVPHGLGHLHVFVVKMLYIYEPCAFIKRIENSQASIFSIIEMHTRKCFNIVFAHSVLLWNDIFIRVVMLHISWTYGRLVIWTKWYATILRMGVLVIVNCVWVSTFLVSTCWVSTA